MTSTTPVVVEKPMDEIWSARAEEIVRTGEGEGVYYFHGHDPLRPYRALFAFGSEEGRPGDAIGVLLFRESDDEDDVRSLWLEYLSVLPAHRKNGIATSLIKTAYVFASEMGCMRLWAITGTYNYPMMKRLQSQGFSQEFIYMSQNVSESIPDDEFSDL